MADSDNVNPADDTRSGLPAPDEILLADRAEFEHYVHRTAFTKEQRELLKAQRRRRKNAVYAREHRARRAAQRSTALALRGDEANGASLAITDEIPDDDRSSKPARRRTPPSLSSRAKRPQTSFHTASSPPSSLSLGSTQLGSDAENRLLRIFLQRLGYDPDTVISQMMAEQQQSALVMQPVSASVQTSALLAQQSTLYQQQQLQILQQQAHVQQHQQQLNAYYESHSLPMATPSHFGASPAVYQTAAVTGDGLNAYSQPFLQPNLPLSLPQFTSYLPMPPYSTAGNMQQPRTPWQQPPGGMLPPTAGMPPFSAPSMYRQTFPMRSFPTETV
eukprot:TRINITY_DN6186_c0_g1_i2.p1 TRINITY_DN6186_c0_g1~~TRINITY_DN6186_c0_g1_i2.p1  ORF type:complete len:332 (+),score=42.74 TRINITY_DN6186_c0_g1_i2:221-1216(+)